MWVNVFEVIFALPLVFVIIPIQGLSIYEIPKNVLDGYKCLLKGEPSLHGDMCTHCTNYSYSDALVLLIFLLFGFIIIMDKANSAYILKHNSSTLMWIAATCAVPLSSILFTFPFIMGNAAVSIFLCIEPWKPSSSYLYSLLDVEMSNYIIVGLIVVMIGLIIYRSTKERIWYFEDKNTDT